MTDIFFPIYIGVLVKVVTWYQAAAVRIQKASVRAHSKAAFLRSAHFQPCFGSVFPQACSPPWPSSLRTEQSQYLGGCLLRTCHLPLKIMSNFAKPHPKTQICEYMKSWSTDVPDSQCFPQTRPGMGLRTKSPTLTSDFHERFQSSKCIANSHFGGLCENLVDVRPRCVLQTTG